MADHIYTEPGRAAAEKGRVLLDGPDGIAVTLTPDAAEGTGRELIRAAEQARLQIVTSPASISEE